MLNVNNILEATKGKKINGENLDILSYSISSNEINEKCMFIPLKGEKTDGHKYIISAVKNGCIGFLISKNYNNKVDVIEESLKINEKIIIIEVEDTLEALKNMARYVRRKNNDIPVIAVTGSVGKTSTREMINSVLSKKYSVLKTIKNYNSNIGIPLMLLMYNNEEIMLLEAGMDGKGQLEEISDIIKPNLSVITNIGTAHIGILGSRENIFKAKMEITKGMNEDSTLIINQDDDYLRKVKDKNLIKISQENVQNIILKEDSTEFDYKGNHFIINVPGRFQIYNALIAIEIGIKFDIPMNLIKEGIEEYKNFEKRMQKYEFKNDFIVIDDSYNASLTSMKYGLEIINKCKSSNKIIVLGDMLELGEYSKSLHEELGTEINKYNFTKIYLYGNKIKYCYDKISNKTNVKYFNDKEELIKNILKSDCNKDTTIYFKASNGMKLYDVIDKIINYENLI